MSNTQTQAVSLPPSIVEAYGRLDAICHQSAGIFNAKAGPASFAKDLQLASAIGAMRSILTKEVMQPIMDLMNSDLGFKTDRDPARPVWNPQTRQMESKEPYPVETVRECFIAASLRGLRPVNNEWNIISGQTYATRNGLKRQCEEYEGVKNLRVDLGIPRLVGDKGAIVKVAGSWFKEGIKDSIEAEIPVRVNASMGADAILGKAERKIYHRILGRLTGSSTPEGDVTENDSVVDITGTVSPSKEPLFEGPKAETTPSASASETNDPNWDLPTEAPLDIASPSASQAQPTTVVEPPPQPQPPPLPKPVAPQVTPHVAPAPMQQPPPPLNDATRKIILELRDLSIRSEITEGQLVGWAVYMKLAPPGTATLEEIKPKDLMSIRSKWTQLSPRIKEYTV